MTDKAEALAQAFHEAYEQLAPSFGYETREASAVTWDDVPEQNKHLMVAVASHILAEFLPTAPGVRVNSRAIDIVFDGPPSHLSGRFVEVEDENRRSISVGRWIARDDGFWALRFTGEDLARGQE